VTGVESIDHHRSAVGPRRIHTEGSAATDRPIVDDRPTVHHRPMHATPNR